MPCNHIFNFQVTVEKVIEVPVEKVVERVITVERVVENPITIVHVETLIKEVPVDVIHEVLRTQFAFLCNKSDTLLRVITMV